MFLTLTGARIVVFGKVFSCFSAEGRLSLSVLKMDFPRLCLELHVT
jgi:hypothetical protein